MLTSLTAVCLLLVASSGAPAEAGFADSLSLRFAEPLALLSPSVVPLKGPGFSLRTLKGKYDAKSAKDGKAFEFKSAGSNYRIWNPDASPTPGGGLLVSFKLDHIRGMATDDHAQVEMEFDAGGKLLSASSSITMAGATKISSEKVAAAGAVVGIAPEAWVAAEVVKAFSSIVEKEHGGRANFPSVVKHAINQVAGSVRG